jgi:hypothetical protein
LHPRRPGTPFPDGFGDDALQERWDLLLAPRLRCQNSIVLQIQTEGDLGTERISVLPGKPEGQADRAHLPGLERLLLRNRENPPPGLLHPFSFRVEERTPGAPFRTIYYGKTERIGEPRVRKGESLQIAKPAPQAAGRT